MKGLSLVLALGSFFLVDLVVLLACCNIVQWTTIDAALLWKLLFAGVIGMVAGLVSLGLLNRSSKGKSL